MDHHNPLLAAGGKKFITIGEIMLRLTPPNYDKIRDVDKRQPMAWWIMPSTWRG